MVNTIAQHGQLWVDHWWTRPVLWCLFQWHCALLLEGTLIERGRGLRASRLLIIVFTTCLCARPHLRMRISSLRFLMKRPHVGHITKRRCGQKLTLKQYDELLSKLTKLRDNICCSSAGFSYLGPDIVCPRPVINQLCKIAKSVHTIDDIKKPGLRPQLIM